MGGAPAPDAYAVAEAVRTACIGAVLRAYEDAGLRGLCVEGRWEVAVAALRELDLDGLVAGAVADQEGIESEVGEE